MSLVFAFLHVSDDSVLMARSAKASKRPGRFGGFFRSEKFPDPELSVGIHLQEIQDRNLQIWDAVGPARASFDQLSSDIKAHLFKFGDSFYGEVRWTLCMIGPAKEAARPTIVFLSSDPAPRKTVKQQIKSSGVLKNYPGFVTMDCNRPPGFVEVISLGQSDDKLVITTSDPHLSSNDGLLFENIEGAMILVGSNHAEDPEIMKKATAGGVIRWQEENFVMTVAHIFPGYSGEVFSQTTEPSAFVYELDSCGEEDNIEYDDDEAIDEMSNASMSPHDSGSEDAALSDDSKAPSTLVEPQPPFGNLSPISLVENVKQLSTATGDFDAGNSEESMEVLPQLDSQIRLDIDDHNASSQSITPQETDTLKEVSVMLQFRDGRKSERLLFRPIMSNDQRGPFLDYALLPIVNFHYGGGAEPDDKELERETAPVWTREEPEEHRPNISVDIVTTTVSGGLTKGQLLATPTILQLACGRSSQELWTVKLQSRLVIGDSGSWVRDANTGNVFGHLIAGSPEVGLAYLVPISDVLKDLRQRFEGDWDLVKSNPVPKFTRRNLSPSVDPIPDDISEVQLRSNPNDQKVGDYPTPDSIDEIGIATGSGHEDNDDSIIDGWDTVTIDSSITNYRIENGRTYHAYRDGSYWAPNDDKQNDFLDISHHLFYKVLEEKHFLAPVREDIKRVLDLGTGTGIWAVEFADMFPNAAVLGNDLSPIQPNFVPPNCTFEIDDIRDEWSYPPDYFDYIHIRGLYGSIEDWPQLYSRAYKCLKPGGYIEQAEVSVKIKADDGTAFESGPLHQFSEIFMDADKRANAQRFCITETMTRDIERVGFVNLVEKTYKIPIGRWPVDPKLREIGMLARYCLGADLEGYISATLTRALGCNLDKVNRMCAEVQAAIKDRSIHSYYELKCLYAQRPLFGFEP